MITSKNIKAYRASAKKIGLWDKDYSSIKRGLSECLSDIRGRDFALDIVGSSFMQIILMARLALYGDSEVELSDEDLETAFSPIKSVEGIERAPYMLAHGAKDVSDNLFPLFFDVMSKSDDFEEFERHMRILISSSSNIPTFALSMSISLGICMRKYNGISAHLTLLNEKLHKLAKRSNIYDGLISRLNSQFKRDTIFGMASEFSALLSLVIIECNLGKTVSYDELYDFMEELEDVMKNNRQMYDFFKSPEFTLLMKAAEKYHELG